MNERKIFEILKNTRDRALANYSHFKVGAVIISEDEKIFTGHNSESSSYGLTVCAERVALFKALSEGIRKFKKIYILAEDNDFCPPCGACRQLLIEYAPDIEVILFTDNMKRKQIKLKELLPLAFTKNRLPE